MSKFTPPKFNSLQNESSFLGSLNTTMDRIKSAFDNTFSRDGTTPNQMGADLDINSNKIINLPQATAPGEAVEYTQLQDTLDEIADDITYIDSQVLEATNQADRSESEANDAEGSANSAAADLATMEALLETYNNSFLGTFASDPVLDNSGDALDVGDIYYNSVSLALRVYDGTNWQDVASLTPTSSNVVSNKIYDGAVFRNNLTPETSDGSQIGSTTKMFSDLFLASGGVINWNNGAVTITHSGNALAFAGASSGYAFDAPLSIVGSAPSITLTDSDTGADNVISGNSSAGVLTLFADINNEVASSYVLFNTDGTNQVAVGQGVLRPWTDDAISLGQTAAKFSDLFLASGAVINFNSGDVTLTHSTNNLAINGGALSLDNNFSIDSTGANPVITFDNGDGLIYDKTNNSYYFNIANNTEFLITANGIYPDTSGSSSALGNTARTWIGLWLSSGGQLNFNNSDVTVTHGTNTLTFAGASSGYSFDAPIIRDTNFWLDIPSSDPVLKMDSGDQLQYSRSNDQWYFYINSIIELIIHAGGLAPGVNDGGALGTSSLGWSDLFLATGAVLNFANGDVVLTHSSGVLTLGTGDLRVTTAGTNAASVVTVNGTQTLANKSLTAPALGTPASGTLNNCTTNTETQRNNSTQLASTAYADAQVDAATIINTQTASYIAVLGDAGKTVEMNVASGNTFTVPPNSSVAFPVGTYLNVVQYGAGQVTITPGAGVTIRAAGSALKTRSTYSTATIYKRATDEWVASGDLTT